MVTVPRDKGSSKDTISTAATPLKPLGPLNMTLLDGKTLARGNVTCTGGFTLMTW